MCQSREDGRQIPLVGKFYPFCEITCITTSVTDWKRKCKKYWSNAGLFGEGDSVKVNLIVP